MHTGFTQIAVDKYNISPVCAKEIAKFADIVLLPSRGNELVIINLRQPSLYWRENRRLVRMVLYDSTTVKLLWGLMIWSLRDAWRNVFLLNLFLAMKMRPLSLFLDSLDYTDNRNIILFC